MPGIRLAGFRAVGPADVRVVPHPAITLVLEFGNGPLVVDVASGRQRRGDLVAGYLHGGLRVRGAGVECLQVRLSPVIARAVLGVAPAELDGVVVALEDLWGREAVRVRERLGEVSSWRDRFALVEGFLAGRGASGGSVDGEVAWVWGRILRSCGRVRVEELAGEVGWSRKRLWQRFRGQVGLGPKRAARLVRFDWAVHRLAGGVGVGRVAAEGGYVDQSHLHRDVVAFSGVTPVAVAGGQWLAVDDLAWPARAVSPL
ncbi:helix-turn-helix domain-containing protein [Crossiella sp. CA198]|uniref:helix-turn-helix domain-containing protein n=1 Tax=Crossiella sp. CA198 TaxID=3455607 RepID=UPI003F8D890E